MAAHWKPALAVAVLALCAEAAAIDRDGRAVAAFKRQHPCPATGQARGPCPGWIVDHITPLCADGPDTPANMQWQRIADARAKDRDEMMQCSNLRRPSIP